MARTLLIADDHVVWRQGLRSLLQPDFQVIAEAHDGREAVSKTLAVQPDLVILDFRMPAMDGLAAARQIRQSLPAVGLVIISAATDPGLILHAAAAGVDACLCKDESPDAILEAVHKVAAVDRCRPLTQHGTVGSGPPASLPENTPPTVQLSQRELTVLGMMARGLRHKQMATELGISPRTVGNYVVSIYNKLGVNDRGHAVVDAIKRGIVRV